MLPSGKATGRYWRERNRRAPAVLSGAWTPSRHDRMRYCATLQPVGMCRMKDAKRYVLLRIVLTVTFRYCLANQQPKLEYSWRNKGCFSESRWHLPEHGSGWLT